MSLNSAILNFYWSHTIVLQKLSNERSYKFSCILTLTEVINIRILSVRLNAVEPKRNIKKLFARDNRQTTTTDETAFQYSHHGCELIIFSILWTKRKDFSPKKESEKYPRKKVTVRFYVNYLLHPYYE